VKKVFFFCVLLVLLLQVPAHALDVPKLTGYVNDYAGMISPQAKAEIENELAEFERTDSTQIVILTVPSLEGDPIEDFGIRVADAWKIGQKGKDNGVIFIVSKGDRKTRIEVGQGLEGKLTDLMAGRIVDLVVAPRFKSGDFDGGFMAGAQALVEVTRGEFKADGNRFAKRHENPSRFFSLIIFFAFVLLVIGGISRILGVVVGAVGLPAIALLAFSSVGVVLLIILAAVGIFIGLVLPILFSSGGRGGFGGFGGGGFYGGGFGGGGGGDFGGGFGGGGGGGFGGGGASGGW
jgi:uncharacterized protein